MVNVREAASGPVKLMFCAALALAAVVMMGFLSAPASAWAVEGAASEGQELSAQAATIKLATTDKAKLDALAAKYAKAIVKEVGATSGTDAAKLKRIYTYVSTPKAYKGAFESVGYFEYLMAARSDNAQAAFYPALQPANMKTYFKKYVADAYTSKKVTCYHNAALFAVAAKQALGKSAKVSLVIGGTNVTGTWNAHHCWVEVKFDAGTCLYDPMNGHYYSTDVAKAKGKFGPFCGTKKGKATVNKYYRNGDAAPFKGASACTVVL